MCVSEDDILFFNRVKDDLYPIKALVPSKTAIEKVLSKEFTAQTAKQIGINTPDSWQINTLTEVDKLEEQLTFPVILKWSNPHTVLKKAREHKVKIEKLIYCYNFADLRQQLSIYSPLNSFPMIQNYIPGYGLGQFFFMHQGKALLRFQHQRLHEWPPEGGFSSLSESVPLSEYQQLQEQSINLLTKLNWQGVAMVEYRYDPKNQKPVLMEINGRFWGSLPLAYHSGVPFAWYTYMVQGKNELPIKPLQIKEKIQCRNTLVEVKRLNRILFNSSKIKDKTLSFNKAFEVLVVLSGFFNPKMHYYLFEVSDLKPMLADWKILFLKFVNKLKR